MQITISNDTVQVRVNSSCCCCSCSVLSLFCLLQSRASHRSGINYGHDDMEEEGVNARGGLFGGRMRSDQSVSFSGAGASSGLRFRGNDAPANEIVTNRGPLFQRALQRQAVFTPVGQLSLWTHFCLPFLSTLASQRQQPANRFGITSYYPEDEEDAPAPAASYVCSLDILLLSNFHRAQAFFLSSFSPPYCRNAPLRSATRMAGSENSDGVRFLLQQRKFERITFFRWILLSFPKFIFDKNKNRDNIYGKH